MNKDYFCLVCGLHRFKSLADVQVNFDSFERKVFKVKKKSTMIDQCCQSFDNSWIHFVFCIASLNLITRYLHVIVMSEGIMSWEIFQYFFQWNKNRRKYVKTEKKRFSTYSSVFFPPILLMKQTIIKQLHDFNTLSQGWSGARTLWAGWAPEDSRDLR